MRYCVFAGARLTYDVNDFCDVLLSHDGNVVEICLEILLCKILSHNRNMHWEISQKTKKALITGLAATYSPMP